MASHVHIQPATSGSSSVSVLYPVSTEAGWQRAYRGIALSSLAASGVGSVLGLKHNTAIGPYAASTAFNTALGATAWFGIRELVISPVLLKFGLTEEARRRYQGVLLERKRRSGPLEDQSWNCMRTDRVLDTGLTSAIFFAVGPPLYQELKARTTTLKPVRNPLSFTLGSAAFLGIASALGQWAANEIRIHNWRLYEAYDSFGPIPGVDILAIRKAERERLVASVSREVHPAVAAREAARRQEAEAKRRKEEELRASGTVLASDLVRQRLHPLDPARFMQDAMPRMSTLSAQETLDRLEQEADEWRQELAEVRREMAAIGLQPTPDIGRWGIRSGVSTGDEPLLSENR